MVFLSNPVSAEQLCAWNVVNRVVEDAGLDQAARELAMRLATGPTRADAATKALWRLQAGAGGSTAREKLYDYSMPLFETRDARAALKASAEAVDIDPATVETNIVRFRLRGISASQFVDEAHRLGVHMLPSGLNAVRAVFYLDITDSDVERASGAPWHSRRQAIAHLLF